MLVSANQPASPSWIAVCLELDVFLTGPKRRLPIARIGGIFRSQLTDLQPGLLFSGRGTPSALVHRASSSPEGRRASPTTVAQHGRNVGANQSFDACGFVWIVRTERKAAWKQDRDLEDYPSRPRSDVRPHDRWCGEILRIVVDQVFPEEIHDQHSAEFQPAHGTLNHLPEIADRQVRRRSGFGRAKH